jgi:hypothetical protein
MTFGDRALLRSLGGPASLQDWQAARRSGGPQSFLIPFGGLARYRDAAIEWLPGAIAETVQAANAICDHTFDLLGSGPSSLGKAIDWHRDCRSGHRWPLQYHRVMPRLFNRGGDIKRVWELSRCYQAMTLGKAYVHTGDESHAQELADQLLDWIANNPPGFGPNWYCAMDVAIRALNWLWGYHLCAGSRAWTQHLESTLLRSLLFHGRFIAANLENTERTPANHYLANLLGLLALALCLPEVAEFAEREEWAVGELWRQTELQFLPSGANFEGSIPYHRLATEIMLVAVLLCKRAGREVPTSVLCRLERACEFTLGYTRPDGLCPGFGDSGDDRVHVLSELSRRNPYDHRHLLAPAAVLFCREDFARAGAAYGEDVLWLLGPEGLADFVGMKAGIEPGHSVPRSCAYEDAGLYVMRRNDDYLAANVGLAASDRPTSHRHSDTLSFEWCAAGHPVIVDSGALGYTGDYAERNRSRSSWAHNVLIVDGWEINEFASDAPWHFVDRARAEVVSWQSTDERDVLVARHYAYEDLPSPVVHERTFTNDKLVGRWTIADRLVGAGDHRAEYLLHFRSVPSCRLWEEDDAIVVEAQIAPHLTVGLRVCPTRGLHLRLAEDKRAARYGQSQPCLVLSLEGSVALPWELQTVLTYTAAEDQTTE